MKATIEQLAWYIERDGGIVSYPKGVCTVRVPLFGGLGHITYEVPEDLEAELNAKRDAVYAKLAAKRRGAK